MPTDVSYFAIDQSSALVEMLPKNVFNTLSSVAAVSVFRLLSLVWPVDRGKMNNAETV